jgi:hypothetical protein
MNFLAKAIFNSEKNSVVQPFAKVFFFIEKIKQFLKKIEELKCRFS